MTKPDTHSNSKALFDAIARSKTSKINKLIERDPTVLAYPFPDPKAVRFYYPLLYAIANSNRKETTEAILQGLRKHEAKIHAEFVKRGAEKDLLQGNLLYALSYEKNRPVLPHIVAGAYGKQGIGSYDAFLLLSRYGYDLNVHAPHQNPLLAKIILEIFGRLVKEENFKELIAAFEHKDMSAMNRGYTDYSHPDLPKRKYLENLPSAAFFYFHAIAARPADQNSASIANNFMTLAEAGIDLRQVMEYPTQPNTHGQTVKDALSARGTAQSEPGEIRKSTRFSCATGRLPLVLHRLAGKDDQAGMTRIIENLDEYWREQYRHSIRRAEAVLVRKGPVEGSALGAWARGAI